MKSGTNDDCKIYYAVVNERFKIIQDGFIFFSLADRVSAANLSSIDANSLHPETDQGFKLGVIAASPGSFFDAFISVHFINDNIREDAKALRLLHPST